MSWGITPYELVQQVFYAQEKVLLDFHPKDDKYREVIMEANLVLQELQKEEDWSWLRERLVLGPCRTVSGRNEIPEFEMPDWVYKPSTLHDDCVRLHAVDRCGRIVEDDFIRVPWASTGALHRRHVKPYQGWVLNEPDDSLVATFLGNLVTFNRPLTRRERSRVAVTDVQRRIPLLHICGDSCEDECEHVEDRVLTEVPDPNYVVIRTAALHAPGSPVASARAMDLTDQAQKLLSAMRSNDAAATMPDVVDWDSFHHVSVM